jgi:3-hydroxyisobutyrate dehydrogenase
LALVADLKLPPDKVIDILSDTAGTPTAMKLRGDEIARVLDGRPPSPAAFALEGARKDLATMIAEAAAHGRRLPVTQSALQSYDAAIADGLGDGDAMRVTVRVAQLAKKA